jgi:hypothetical protein
MHNVISQGCHCAFSLKEMEQRSLLVYLKSMSEVNDTATFRKVAKMQSKNGGAQM